MNLDVKLDWLFLDVDGVLTDGRLVYTENGEETKIFHVLDGYGIMKVLLSGIKIAIISGRGCLALERRLAELNVTEVYTNCPQKEVAFNSLLKKYGDEVYNSAHIGDDEPDLALFKFVKFKVAVANAHDKVLSEADLILKRNGGYGAVREFCDLIC